MSWWHLWGKRHKAEPNAKEKATDEILSEPEPIELTLYESSSKPTKIKKKGMAVSGRGEGEEVKKHFLEFDGAYDGLFKSVFEEKAIDEIDELNHDDRNGMGAVFAITAGATKINAAYEFFFEDIIAFSIDGKRYEFTRPTYTSGLFPKGYYNFSGEQLDEKDYRELVEPNAHMRKDEPGSSAKKFCFRKDDGSSGGTIKAEVVPELMKRIISYSADGVK